MQRVSLCSASTHLCHACCCAGTAQMFFSGYTDEARADELASVLLL